MRTEDMVADAREPTVQDKLDAVKRRIEMAEKAILALKWLDQYGSTAPRMMTLEYQGPGTQMQGFREVMHSAIAEVTRSLPTALIQIRKNCEAVIAVAVGERS